MSIEQIETIKNYIFYVAAIVGIYLLRNYFNGPKTKLKKNLEGKVVVVTGSSDGIGVETAYELLKSGATIIFACRDEKKTQKVINSIKDENQRKRAHFIKLDLMTFDSVIRFAIEFKSKFQQLDILVNNAAAQFKSFKKTPDNIEQTLQVNTLSPMLLTFCLLDVINKSKGKIINVSSDGYKYWKKDAKYYEEVDVHSEKSEDYSGFFQYCYSKLGNIYFTQELNQYIQSNNLNIQTAAVHPGVIITELGRDYKGFAFYVLLTVAYPLIWFFTKSINMGAQTTLHACYADENEFKCGQYYVDCKPKKLQEHAHDKSTRRAFIALTKRYFALNKEASGYYKF